ncbi:MAG: hypothetical protein ABII80_01785 [bacterium]
MTKYLFHGDNQRDSRRNFQLVLAKEKSLGQEIRSLDGLKISPTELSSVLATANLFANETIILENLGSRPISGDKKILLSLIKDYSGPKTILLWEKKELTKAVLNSLGSGIVSQLSKTPPIIFKFLDSLAPGSLKNSLQLLHQTKDQVEEGFIFIMLARHLADLIVAKSGDQSSLNPWKRSRLVEQARLWPEPLLLRFHHSLLDLDYRLKTGATKLSYLEQLDILLVTLLG